MYEHTLPTDPGADWSVWHRGRTFAAAWVMLLPAPADHLVAEARRRLGDLIWPDFARQPHVTVRFAGLLAERGLPGHDESSLARDLDALSGVLDGPVEITTTVWGTFPTTPHLGVEGQWLHRAHAALPADGDDLPAYRPHLSVGSHRHRVPITQVLESLGEAPEPVTWTLGRLHFVRYRAVEFDGPLEVIGHVDLTDGRFVTAASSPGV